MSYGLKVSRQGYDVNSASDRQLAFSSEWPLLPIEAEGTFTIENGETYDEVIYTHNLGYEPVFYVWEENDSKLYPGGKLYVYNFYVTTTALHINDSTFTDSTIHWKIFRRPLKTNYDSGTLISTDTTEEDSADYGIKVSLPGKGVSSTDKRDFGVRSDVRQFMIHMSGYDEDIYEKTITHNLGYRPMYWLYFASPDALGRNPEGAYSLVPSADDMVWEITTTTFYWWFTAGYLDDPVLGDYVFDWAYILFKDPINESG